MALAVVLVAVPLGLVPVLALERVFLACEDLAAAQSGLAVASKTEHDMKPQLYVEYIPIYTTILANHGSNLLLHPHTGS